MRRKDREMDEQFALALIDGAEFGVLSLAAPDGSPYALPLSLAREGRTLYFHSARAGTKVDLLPDGTPVTVVFVGEARVSDRYSRDEVENLLKEPGGVGKLGSRVFTTAFASAIVNGSVRRLVDEADRLHGLRVISQKYVPDKMEFFEHVALPALPITFVYAVSIDTVTAKRKKLD